MLVGPALGHLTFSEVIGAFLATGVLMLLLFIPEHVRLWDKFPVWYHLTFLGSLVPLRVAGGRLTGRAPPAG